MAAGGVSPAQSCYLTFISYTQPKHMTIPDNLPAPRRQPRLRPAASATAPPTASNRTTPGAAPNAYASCQEAEYLQAELALMYGEPPGPEAHH
jgi:hypothetical protein